MLRFFLVLALFLTALLAPGQSKDAFKDTPQTHWVIQDLEHFKKDGLLAGYPDGIGRGHQPWSSRFEIAVAVSTSFTNLKSWADGVGAGTRQLATMKPGPHKDEYQSAISEELQELKHKVPIWQPEFLKLIKFFQKELRTLGLDTVAMTKQVKASCALVVRSQIGHAGHLLV